VGLLASLFGHPRPPTSPEGQGSPAYEHEVRWRPTGWRGLADPPSPHQQNGVYLDAILSQYPARWEGAQLDCAVGSTFPGWMVDSRSALPTFQQTQQKTPVAGAQLYGSRAGDIAGAGPWASRRLRQSVLEATIIQGGTSAMSWADQLKVWGAGGRTTTSSTDG
jgi:hypothetical protein